MARGCGHVVDIDVVCPVANTTLAEDEVEIVTQICIEAARDALLPP
jgi:hypothetical protein